MMQKTQRQSQSENRKSTLKEISPHLLSAISGGGGKLKKLAKKATLGHLA